MKKIKSAVLWAVMAVVLILVGVGFYFFIYENGNRNPLNTNNINNGSDNHQNLPPFIPSEVLYQNSETTGKPDQYYCFYDSTRNKVAIVIKENGIYDNSLTVPKFNDYFSAVKNHLQISSVGVKKFSGSGINEMDLFINELVKDEAVGYVIFVGSDLPIVNTADGQILFGIDAINKYEYVGREGIGEESGCIDVAISGVFAPEGYSIDEKRSFVSDVFSNFINYHLDPQGTFAKFNKEIFVDVWDDTLTDFGAQLNGEEIYNPQNHVDYDTPYFYTSTFTLNSNHVKVNQELKKHPLFFRYAIHGNDDRLGMGLNSDVYVTNQEILNFVQTNGQISLFVSPFIACGQDWLSNGFENQFNDIEIANRFCCWPQTWLKQGAWSFYTVNGAPSHTSFERAFFEEKVLGRALRKTYHNQAMIYGDILATAP